MFITLEGGEGAGKSTLARAISEHLSAEGVVHTVTREPGGTPVAERVRDIALHQDEGGALSPLAVALLMNAARADHLDRLIRPALAEGRVVICDRFSDSTLVYQSVEGGVSAELLRAMEEAVVGKTRPDLTLLLDAEPEALLSRRKARGGSDDVFESRGMDFHRDIRRAFLDLAKADPSRFRVLDALSSPTSLAERAIALIKEHRHAGARP